MISSLIFVQKIRFLLQNLCIESQITKIEIKLKSQRIFNHLGDKYSTKIQPFIFLFPKDVILPTMKNQLELSSLELQIQKNLVFVKPSMRKMIFIKVISEKEKVNIMIFLNINIIALVANEIKINDCR